MRMSKLVPCTVVAAMLAASAIPAPAAAQIGGVLKRKLKETAGRVVAGTDPNAAAPDRSSAAGGPRFSESVLEISSELLDRLEKGLGAEAAVRQEIELRIGKVLGREEYERCSTAVLSGPEGLRVYEQSRDLARGDTSYERIQKASQELARRMEQVIEPKCGLEPRKAEAIRSQNTERLAAAARDASGLTQLQLSILKERILPLCAATQAMGDAASAVRIPAGSQTGANPIYYVYTPAEAQALQPRCPTLASALRKAL